MGANIKSGIGAYRAQHVYQILRRAILDQGLKPGSKLPEDAIGEQLKVSRTVVREALARLSGEGLVELRHNRGATVAYPSLEEAREVFTVRRAMERLVVEELAGRLSAADVKKLRDHVEKERSARGLDAIRLAGEFHLMLPEIVGNALLSRYVREVASRCTLILSIYGRPHSSECAVDEHLQLIAALEAGDREKAIQLMEHHLVSVMDRALIESHVQDDIHSILAIYTHPEEGDESHGRQPDKKSRKGGLRTS